MVSLEGKTIRLRAVEPGDIPLMYEWENDPDIWSVSGTTSPFSQHALEKFIENQQFGIHETHQLRLIIETLLSHKPVGMLDLYDYDLLNGRAGVGILIHPYEERGRGYATDALETLYDYARKTLRLHQLWCEIGADNEASLALFRRAGFTQTGIKRQWENKGYKFLDIIFMQKILGGGLYGCEVNYEL